MDLDDMIGKAKELAEEHRDDLEQHADDLKDIATGDGSVADKAKAAFDELRGGSDSSP
jgi:hypothetical protein